MRRSNLRGRGGAGDGNRTRIASLEGCSAGLCSRRRDWTSVEKLLGGTSSAGNNERVERVREDVTDGKVSYDGPDSDIDLLVVTPTGGHCQLRIQLMNILSQRSRTIRWQTQE